MLPPVDVTKLPLAARKALEPGAPATLKQMAASGVAPGLKPAEIVTLVVLFAWGENHAVAEIARKTLANLPAPILTGALGHDLEPLVIGELADRYLNRADVMEGLLAMPRIANETVESVSHRTNNEQVAELIGTNEQRLLAHPPIIERLYMNPATRMSTADRIIELAVRNKLELTSIPAYREVAIAIGQEMIVEPTPEPTPDDILFRETLAKGAELGFDALTEDTHTVTDEGEEQVNEKVKPLYARLGDMTIAQKIRLAMLGSSAERLLLMRDSNKLVAAAAIQSPKIQDAEVVRISASRGVSEEVLRVIARNKEWVQNYRVKLNLVENPRTPFPMATRLMSYMRENDLKHIAKSKNVTGPVATAAKQQLQRKTR
jgi:hypothetical protein